MIPKPTQSIPSPMSGNVVHRQSDSENPSSEMIPSQPCEVYRDQASINRGGMRIKSRHQKAPIAKNGREAITRRKEAPLLLSELESGDLYGLDSQNHLRSRWLEEGP